MIDGFSQPGSQPNTAAPWQASNAVHRIVVSGAGVGASGNGLVVRGDGSIVRGLAVVDFPWHGLVLEAEDISVEGCLIGTDDAGTAGLGNGFSGIWINGGGEARIGGAAPEARNVISGNGNFGVLVYGAGASGAQVQGNFIGTNPAGTALLGNGFSGVLTGSNVVFSEPNPTGGAGRAHRRSSLWRRQPDLGQHGLWHRDLRVQPRRRGHLARRHARRGEPHRDEWRWDGGGPQQPRGHPRAPQPYRRHHRRPGLWRGQRRLRQ